MIYNTITIAYRTRIKVFCFVCWYYTCVLEEKWWQDALCGIVADKEHCGLWMSFQNVKATGPWKKNVHNSWFVTAPSAYLITQEILGQQFQQNSDILIQGSPVFLKGPQEFLMHAVQWWCPRRVSGWTSCHGSEDKQNGFNQQKILDIWDLDMLHSRYYIYRTNT